MSNSSLLLDWSIHIGIVLTTILIVDRKECVSAIFLGILLNVFYIGQYLDAARRRQYFLMVECISQFSQAISNPSLAFFMAALNSYFSMSRMKISLAALVLLHYRTSIALLFAQYTGSRASWILLELLQHGMIALELQTIFVVISSILRGVLMYQRWEELHPLPAPDQTQEIQTDVLATSLNND